MSAHDRHAKQAEQTARTSASYEAAAITHALLAIYRLLEERLPSPEPPLLVAEGDPDQSIGAVTPPE